jgi:hypothetical protein
MVYHTWHRRVANGVHAYLVQSIDIRFHRVYFDGAFRPQLEESLSSMALTLQLDKIQEVVQVSTGKAMQLMETCVWCILASKHSNGVTLKVNEERPVDSYIVSWPDAAIDSELINRSYNQDDAAEDGAEAIALLLSILRTNYTAVQRASTSTGIDYWLGYKDNLNNPFEKAGRLEVSGIFAENETNTVKTRIKSKLKQTLPTDNTFSVYVVVVEFSQPYATIVRK